MIRQLLMAVAGIVLVFGGTLAGFVVAMRWPIECLRRTGDLCEPYLSVVIGPLVGFVVTALIVGSAAKRYYRRFPGRAGAGDQAA